MERYSIFEGHMDDLIKKVTRIQNKCKKYGCEFHFAEVGEEFREVADPSHVDPFSGKPITHTLRFVLVEAEGTAIINDWQFIASVEHTERGNIFSKAMTDVEIPERYRTSKMICEHCNSNRSRSSTFIVMNAVTGEFKQVGKSCLMDFTNGLSASAAAWFASIKQIFVEAENAEPSSFSFSETCFDVSEILAYTAETIRKFGYARTESDRSTKTRVLEYWAINNGKTRWYHEKEVQQFKKEMAEVNFNHKSAEVLEMVNNAMNWIAEQTATNDYMHNLKTACSLRFAKSRHIGILVSLFPTFNRELKNQAKKAEAEARAKKEAQASKHIGSVGDKIQINVQSVKCLSSWENSFSYYPTTTYLYKITDHEGNVFTWKTSTFIDEDHLPETIKGTVKEHGEFKGTKQTVLTRCKMA